MAIIRRPSGNQSSRELGHVRPMVGAVTSHNGGCLPGPRLTHSHIFMIVHTDHGSLLISWKRNYVRAFTGKITRIEGQGLVATSTTHFGENRPS